jgi:hypothetical protein
VSKVESRRDRRQLSPRPARGGINMPRNAFVLSELRVRESIVGDANQRLNTHLLVTVAQNPREG